MMQPRPADRPAPGVAGDETLLLGTELARARAAQQRHGPEDPDVSPLGAVDYPDAAADLWRWVDAPADAVVSAFVTEYARLGPAERARLRSELGMDDFYTLVVFARRRALAALRTGAAAEVSAAFDALSAIELERIDWRDVWVAAALAGYAAERIGLEPADVVRGPAYRAEPDVADLLTEVAADSVDLTEECGYREVDTPSGRVLVEDEGEDYAPEADLLALAMAVAVLLERDDYRVGEVTVATELPDVWLGGGGNAAIRHALHRLTGCAQLHAEPRGPIVASDHHFLLVYLAEAASAEDAATIAGAAAWNAPEGAVELGVSSDRYCAVLIARSAVTGVPAMEDEASIARFRPGIAALLPG